MILCKFPLPGITYTTHGNNCNQSDPTRSLPIAPIAAGCTALEYATLLSSVSSSPRFYDLFYNPTRLHDWIHYPGGFLNPYSCFFAVIVKLIQTAFTMLSQKQVAAQKQNTRWLNEGASNRPGIFIIFPDHQTVKQFLCTLSD